MAFVPGFEHDVFISYAHIDNEALSPQEEGWVASFHQRLKIRVERRLGRPDSASIWRDKRVRGNDEFTGVIDDACRRSAVGLFLLSPGFVASKWCCRELDEFAAGLDGEADRRLGGKSRVFKVLLSHVPDGEIPARLKSTVGYSFYELDRETNREEAYRWTLESDADQRYRTALDDIAQDLADTLKRMKSLAEASAFTPVSIPAGPAVYLAEVTDDLEQDRDDLRRTLVQRGITVLPDRPLPTDGVELRERARDCLRKAPLAVHMVGTFYGKRPAGEPRSFTHLQIDLAAEVAAETGLQRLIWVPRSVDPAAVREEQKQLLATVEDEPAAGSPAEVLKVGIEELKEIVVERVIPKEKALPLPDSAGALIYVDCQPEDDPYADQIRTLLRAARHDVVLPARNGQSDDLEKHYLANLRYCDALLVLYAKSSVIWVREEVVKARRLVAAERRGSGFLMSVLDGPPPGKESIGLDFQNLVVVDCRDGLLAERVRPLLERLGGRA